MKTQIEITSTGLDVSFIEGPQETVFVGNPDNVNCSLDVVVQEKEQEQVNIPFTITPKEIPFVVFAKIGNGEFTAHRLALSWQHNNYFSQTCGTCQAGVGRMMGIIDYLNDRTIFTEEQHIQGEDRPLFDVGFKIDVKLPTHFRILVLKKLETWQDLVEWIRNTMSSSIEGAHIKQLDLRSEQPEQTFSCEGTAF